MDPTEDTDVSEQTVAEQVEVTHTIDITELVTGIPKPTLEATSKENEESTTTSPGSPQRENPMVQNKSRDNIDVNAEQAVKRTHKYPKTNNSIVNKIFFCFQTSKGIPRHNSHVNKTISFSVTQNSNSCSSQIAKEVFQRINKN